MSVADKLAKLTSDINAVYSAIEAKGGTVPANKNTSNLADAVSSLPTIPTQFSVTTQNCTAEIADVTKFTDRMLVWGGYFPTTFVYGGDCGATEWSNTGIVDQNCFGTDAQLLELIGISVEREGEDSVEITIDVVREG